MKKVLVLGNGKMGNVVASTLTKEGFFVETADINKKTKPNIIFDVANSNIQQFINLFKPYDLIVGTLPSIFGFKPIKIAANNGFNYIDLSFTKENLFELNEVAIKNNSIILYDCGLSPGLSNFLVGHIRSLYDPSEITIWVGGISKDPNAPYGHINTWCVEDLLEEYIRPARLIMDGREEIINPLNEEYWNGLYINQIGYLDAFISDGLRSLLHSKIDIPNLTEYTLRRPNHLQSIKPLIKNETFVEEIKKKCSKGDDIVVLKVDYGSSSITMIDYACNNLSAMARTTAFSCAAFAKLVLDNIWTNSGVSPPEEIARNTSCFDYVIDFLANYNVCFDFDDCEDLEEF